MCARTYIHAPLSGLGKTIEMLSLIASSLDELKGEARDDGGDDRTHATLIIVPPALVAQVRLPSVVLCSYIVSNMQELTLIPLYFTVGKRDYKVLW